MRSVKWSAVSDTNILYELLNNWIKIVLDHNLFNLEVYFSAIKGQNIVLVNNNFVRLDIFAMLDNTQ